MAILATVLLFLILLGPAYPQIWNAVRSVFAFILCKEILAKKELSKKEFYLLVRHMQHQPFVVLRKFIVKRNIDTILGKFNKATYKQLEHPLYNKVFFPYRPDYRNYGDNYASSFAVALRNIVKAAPDSFDKIQNLVIDKAREFNQPDIILQFAIAAEDLNCSFRNLYTAITRYRNSTARQTFEFRYKRKPEIERLITISP
jgi:hypothetical protein